MDKNISFTLKVWRQKGPKAKGAFETYQMKDIPGDTSFLEMLDILNEQLISDCLLYTSIDEQMLADIRAAADKEKIEFNEEQYNKSLPLIKTQLKALIARDLWDMNEYFQVINTTNNSVQPVSYTHLS